MVSSTEHHKFDRREINSMKGSENIVRLFEEHSNSIWCDSHTKDERKIKGQKRAAKLHLSGFSLDIYLAMAK